MMAEHHRKASSGTERPFLFITITHLLLRFGEKKNTSERKEKDSVSHPWLSVPRFIHYTLVLAAALALARQAGKELLPVRAAHLWAQTLMKY